MDVKELSLVRDLIIPPNFEVLEFEKYNGTKCPKMHLVSYYHKMVGHAHNGELLIHVFQDSLIRATSIWY